VPLTTTVCLIFIKATSKEDTAYYLTLTAKEKKLKAIDFFRMSGMDASHPEIYLSYTLHSHNSCCPSGDCWGKPGSNPELLHISFI
jgi:hypothetical protein